MTKERLFLSVFFMFAVIASLNTLAKFDHFVKNDPLHDQNSLLIFKKYAGKNCNISTAKKVSFAIEEAGMNSYGEILLSQIALESSCQHTKGNKLVGSKTGAKGLCQITPTTAFQSIKYGLNKEDIRLMKNLGASILDVSEMEYSTTIFGKKHLSKKNRKKVIDWLRSDTNSIALWIVLMRKYENKYGIDGALIAYARGEGGVKRVSIPKKHEYVRHVMSIKNKTFKK